MINGRCIATSGAEPREQVWAESEWFTRYPLEEIVSEKGYCDATRVKMAYKTLLSLVQCMTGTITKTIQRRDKGALCSANMTNNARNKESKNTIVCV